MSGQQSEGWGGGWGWGWGWICWAFWEGEKDPWTHRRQDLPLQIFCYSQYILKSIANYCLLKSYKCFGSIAIIAALDTTMYRAGLVWHWRLFDCYFLHWLCVIDRGYIGSTVSSFLGGRGRMGHVYLRKTVIPAFMFLRKLLHNNSANNFEGDEFSFKTVGRPQPGSHCVFHILFMFTCVWIYIIHARL